MSGKCDELKNKWFNAYPEIMGIEGDEPTQCYGKADVDAAIAELKEAIATLRGANEEKTERIIELQKQVDELKAENERLKNEKKKMYTKLQHDTIIDAMSRSHHKELRDTKRALWLARAERAADRARIFYFNDLQTMLDIDGFSYDSKKKKGHKKLTARLWRIIWLKVERKCLSKAEEYK